MSLIDLFTGELKAARRADKTIQADLCAISLFLEYLGKNGLTVQSAPAHVLSDYVATLRHLAPPSIYKYVNAIRLFHAFLKRRGVSVIDWGRPIMPRLRHTAREVIRGSDLAAFDHACVSLVDPTRTVLRLLLLTGLRPGELRVLGRRDISVVTQPDRVEVWLKIRGTAGSLKSRRDREIPLFPDAAQVLQEYLIQVRPRLLSPSHFLFPGGQGGASKQAAISIVTLEVYTRRAGEAAGIPNLTPYDLRHSALTMFEEQGVPLETIQVIAGHEKITTTMGYLHIAPAKINRDMSKVKTPWVRGG